MAPCLRRARQERFVPPAAVTRNAAQRVRRQPRSPVVCLGRYPIHDPRREATHVRGVQSTTVARVPLHSHRRATPARTCSGSLEPARGPRALHAVRPGGGASAAGAGAAVTDSVTTSHQRLRGAFMPTSSRMPPSWPAHAEVDRKAVGAMTTPSTSGFPHRGLHRTSATCGGALRGTVPGVPATLR